MDARIAVANLFVELQLGSKLNKSALKPLIEALSRSNLGVQGREHLERFARHIEYANPAQPTMHDIALVLLDELSDHIVYEDAGGEINSSALHHKLTRDSEILTGRWGSTTSGWSFRCELAGFLCPGAVN